MCACTTQKTERQYEEAFKAARIPAGDLGSGGDATAGIDQAQVHSTHIFIGTLRFLEDDLLWALQMFLSSPDPPAEHLRCMLLL